MVAKVEAGSPGEKAGLKPNDLITGVNGTPIYGVDGLMDEAEKDPTKPVTLDVQRPIEGTDRFETLHLPYEVPGPVLAGIMEKSPASAAGLQDGDRVVTAGGERMRTRSQFRKFIQAMRAKRSCWNSIARRKTETKKRREVYRKQTATVTPEIPEDMGDPSLEKKPSIGVGFKDDLGFGLDMMGPFNIIHPGPFEADPHRREANHQHDRRGREQEQHRRPSTWVAR